MGFSKKILFSSLVFLLLTFSSIAKTHAIEVDDVTNAVPTAIKLRQEIRELRKDVRQDIKELRASKASEVKNKIRIKACEVHAKAITAKANRIIQKADSMTQRFHAISSSVQNYYLNTLVPQGKTLSNYDALVSDINTKKAAIPPLIEKVKADVSAFSCNVEDPKTAFKSFRTDMQNLIQGIKNYRRSVRALLVAVIGISPRISVTPSTSPAPSTEPGI